MLGKLFGESALSFLSNSWSLSYIFFWYDIINSWTNHSFLNPHSFQGDSKKNQPVSQVCQIRETFPRKFFIRKVKHLPNQKKTPLQKEFFPPFYWAFLQPTLSPHQGGIWEIPFKYPVLLRPLTLFASYTQPPPFLHKPHSFTSFNRYGIHISNGINKFPQWSSLNKEKFLQKNASEEAAGISPFYHLKNPLPKSFSISCIKSINKSQKHSSAFKHINLALSHFPLSPIFFYILVIRKIVCPLCVFNFWANSTASSSSLSYIPSKTPVSLAPIASPSFLQKTPLPPKKYTPLP